MSRIVRTERLQHEKFETKIEEGHLSNIAKRDECQEDGRGAYNKQQNPGFERSLPCEQTISCQEVR